MIPSFPAYCLTTCQTTFSLIPLPKGARLTDAPQHPPASDAGCKGPLINHALYPIWDRYSSDVPTLADEVYDSPVFIATLEVTKIKFDEFAAT
jgi:hypothetical protein